MKPSNGVKGAGPAQKLVRSFLWPVAVVGMSLLASTGFAQGANAGIFNVSPQQMLQGVNAQTVQRFNVASGAVQKTPNDPNALVTRAMVSLEIATKSPYSYQWVQLAAKDLEKALRLDPNNFYAHHNYAMAYYLAGDSSDAQTNMHQAVAQFTRALQLKSDSARTYMGRGWAYLMMDDQTRADADFQKALQLDPSLRDELTRQASAIRQKRGQKGCVQAMTQRMGAYLVEHNARTAGQCASYKGYWTGSECRISTAMAPGPLMLGPKDAATGNSGLAAGDCAAPRDAVNNKYNPRAGGSFVR